MFGFIYFINEHIYVFCNRNFLFNTGAEYCYPVISISSFSDENWVYFDISLKLYFQEMYVQWRL